MSVPLAYNDCILAGEGCILWRRVFLQKALGDYDSDGLEGTMVTEWVLMSQSVGQGPEWGAALVRMVVGEVTPLGGNLTESSVVCDFEFCVFSV